jgi:hypothetical protein
MFTTAITNWINESDNEVVVSCTHRCRNVDCSIYIPLESASLQEFGNTVNGWLVKPDLKTHGLQPCSYVHGEQLLLFTATN